MKKQHYPQASVRELWFLSYPLIITMAAQVVMQFVDRMFLAWYSPEALGACLPAGVLAVTFASVFMGLAGYTGVFVAQYYAKNKKASVAISLWQGILLAVVSAVFLACLTPVGTALINLFNHEQAVRELELQYFKLLNIFGGFAVVNNALSSFFSGRGKTKIPMYAALAGNALNIGLDYIMIFGKLGFAPMGITGAAWATILANIFMTAVFFALIFSRQTREMFKISRLAGFHKPVFMRLLRFGLPNGFGFLMDILSFTLFTFMVGNIDVISLQASNIVLSMQPVVFMVVLGLGMGIQILVSKYQGLKRPDLSVRVVKNACKLGYAYAGVISAILFFGAPLLAALFTPAHTAQAQAIALKTYPLMKLMSLFMWCDATYLIFGEALRGAGDTKFYMYVMIFCAWGLLIPGTWLLVYKWHSSLLAVWWWITFYGALTAAFMVWRFWQGKWKNIVVTES
jgi:MATE family multidrug resistance protein